MVSVHDDSREIAGNLIQTQINYTGKIIQISM